MKALAITLALAAVLLVRCAFRPPHRAAPNGIAKHSARVHALTPPHKGKLPIRLYVSDPLPPAFSLEDLIRENDTIVVGTVTRILLQAPAVRDVEDYSAPPQTVYSFKVEHHFQGGTGDASTIKISCGFGADIDGTHYVVADEPLPQVGSRYLLFLKSARSFPGVMNGYVLGEASGIPGKCMELDEFCAAPGQSMLLLSGGVTTAVYDPYTRGTAPKFLKGDQIVGVPETAALAQVARAVSKIQLQERPYPNRF